MGKKYNEEYAKEIRNIIENYLDNEQALVKQLYFHCKHGTTIGGFREDIWRSMFEQIIPKKFVIEQSVFIIDSNGSISNEVDLAIFDETYTPYIFRYGRLKFVPIEAIAVAIECKSTSLDQGILQNWAEKIAALHTSRESYARMTTGIIAGEDKPISQNAKVAQTATRPIRILCCLSETAVKQLLDNGDSLFDFVIRASEKDAKIHIETDCSKDLQAWYLALNHADPLQLLEKKDMENGERVKDICLDNYKVNFKTQQNQKDELVSLLTFNIQLNQLLMLINNPILFPHKAYAEMFNHFGLEGLK